MSHLRSVDPDLVEPVVTRVSAARTAWARHAAATLHRIHCQSLWWSEDCRREDGGRHARDRWLSLVKSAMSRPDPIAVLHDRVCDASLDGTFGGCPVRAQHVDWYAHMLGHVPAEVDCRG